MIQCQVINCATVVHTTQHNMGRFTNVSGYIDIENIKVLEPCCGSGHILVYIYDLLYL